MALQIGKTITIIVNSINVLELHFGLHSKLQYH